MVRHAVIRAVGALLLATPVAAGASSGEPGHTHHIFAAGEPGDPQKPARIVPVTMREMDDGQMAFFPAEVDVRTGSRSSSS